MRKTLLAGAAAVALLAGHAARADQIIQNGTFASGLSGWESTFGFDSTRSATADGSGSADTAATYYPGSDASQIPPTTCCAHLIQTVTDTAGASYMLSLSAMENAGPTSAIAVYWNGVLEDSWINPANNTIPNWVSLVGSGSYVGTGSDVFELVAYQNPATIWVDNISLSSGAPSTNTVPEPASLLLVGAALAGAAAARRRKAR